MRTGLISTVISLGLGLRVRALGGGSQQIGPFLKRGAEQTGVEFKSSTPQGFKYQCLCGHRMDHSRNAIEACHRCSNRRGVWFCFAPGSLIDPGLIDSSAESLH